MVRPRPEARRWVDRYADAARSPEGEGMIRYVAGRIVQAVVVLWAAFTLTFVILYLLPSNPMQLQLSAAGVQEDSLTKSQLADIKHKFGLDQSLWAQYWHHLFGALHGDFGT